jgi:putative FmdB family regulatory protein
MPVYEYICADCDTRFEKLRPVNRMDDPASCPHGHSSGQRVLSLFAALTKEALGEAAPMAGGCGGSCGAGCACSTN